MVIVLLEAATIHELVPLREDVPYIATFDETSGRLVPDSRYTTLKIENVQQAQITYFLRIWARDLFTIDSQTRERLPGTAVWLRGAAVNEQAEWLEKDRPAQRLIEDPTLTRTVEKNLITYSRAKTAFLHLEWVVRIGGKETSRSRKLIQVDYDLVADQKGDANPIGLAILHFTVVDE